MYKKKELEIAGKQIIDLYYQKAGSNCVSCDCALSFQTMTPTDMSFY